MTFSPQPSFWTHPIVGIYEGSQLWHWYLYNGSVWCWFLGTQPFSASKSQQCWTVHLGISSQWYIHHHPWKHQPYSRLSHGSTWRRINSSTSRRKRSKRLWRSIPINPSTHHDQGKLYSFKQPWLLDEAFKYCNIGRWGDVSRLHRHGSASFQFYR